MINTLSIEREAHLLETTSKEIAQLSSLVCRIGKKGFVYTKSNTLILENYPWTYARKTFGGLIYFIYLFFGGGGLKHRRQIVFDQQGDLYLEEFILGSISQ